MADSDEKQWKRHMRDEESAIQAQQDAAGPDHGPVPGPGHYGDHATNISVREAVLAERARCAQLAAAAGSDPAMLGSLGALSARELEVAAALATAIAQAIRSPAQ